MQSRNGTTLTRIRAWANANRRTIIRAGAIAVAVIVVAINSLPRSAVRAIPPADDAAIEQFISGQLADSGIPGGALAIIRDGRVTDVKGFGRADSSGRPITAQTPFTIGSLTKPITALAVMQLVEAGKVQLDAPVQRYLTESTLADPAAAATITVRELLNQTSGLPTSAGQRPLAQPVTTLQAQVRALRDVAPASAPGTAYAYSNANYLVLGLLVERVSGESYGTYVQGHVFDPLQMRHAHTELASADADGLTRAHRLWFGLAIESAPLWRPDLQPAGFIAASAEDLARFEAAEIAGGSFEGARVLSAEGIAETQRGAVATGSAENGAYGLGWVEMQVGGVRTIAHSGSTTDMAGIEMFAPERGLGIVVLLNGQSTLYERFHKADLIATAAWQQLLGQEATGTIAFFYPAFDVLAALLIAFTSWRLLGLVRRVRRGEPIRPLLLSSRWLGIFVMVWLNGIIPAEILLRLPEVLAAPWAVLVRLDIGLVAFAFAILRLLFGLVLVAVWTRGFVAARRMRPHASAAGASRVG